MSVITARQVRDASKGKVNESNLASVLVALDKYGDVLPLRLLCG